MPWLCRALGQAGWGPASSGSGWCSGPGHKGTFWGPFARFDAWQLCWAPCPCPSLPWHRRGVLQWCWHPACAHCTALSRSPIPSCSHRCAQPAGVPAPVPCRAAGRAPAQCLALAEASSGPLRPDVSPRARGVRPAMMSVPPRHRLGRGVLAAHGPRRGHPRSSRSSLTALSLPLPVQHWRAEVGLSGCLHRTLPPLTPFPCRGGTDIPRAAGMVGTRSDPWGCRHSGHQV